MSAVSTDLGQFLKTMDYPAHQSDLVREAVREGLAPDEVSRLRRIAPRSYSGRFDVLLELRWERATGGPTRISQPLLV